MSGALTRRAALSGAVASVAVLGVATAASLPFEAGSATFRQLMDANAAAERRFNGLPEHLEETDFARFEAEEDRMLDASSATDAATPTTWREYIELLQPMTNGGNTALCKTNAGRLLAHARRLAKMEG